MNDSYINSSGFHSHFSQIWLFTSSSLLGIFFFLFYSVAVFAQWQETEPLGNGAYSVSMMVDDGRESEFQIYSPQAQEKARATLLFYPDGQGSEFSPVLARSWQSDFRIIVLPDRKSLTRYSGTDHLSPGRVTLWNISQNRLIRKTNSKRFFFERIEENVGEVYDYRAAAEFLSEGENGVWFFPPHALETVQNSPALLAKVNTAVLLPARENKLQADLWQGKKILILVPRILSTHFSEFADTTGATLQGYPRTPPGYRLLMQNQESRQAVTSWL